MNPIYEQKPVRVEIDILASARAVPFDNNTGQEIAIWRAQDVAFQVGIFSSNVAVNLFNLAALQLRIFKAATDVLPLVDKVLGPLDIIPTITRAAWTGGTAQQAAFILTAAETDLSLDGTDEAEYFLNIRGITASGAVIDYAGGPITVYNPGPQIYPPMPGVVSNNEQTAVNPGNVTVTPTSVLHGETITVNGPARSLMIIVGVVGLIPGSTVDILLLFPDLTPGIVVTLVSGAADGPVIDTITTDGSQPNCHYRLKTNANAVFKIFTKAFPAYL